LKKSKRLNSWRGGRGRSSADYYVYPTTMSLISWYDGSHEWIQTNHLEKTCNRTLVWGKKGVNKFPTRRSANRAINKFPCEVNLTKIINKRKGDIRSSKSWVYPAATKPPPQMSSSARHFSAGTLVAFNTEVSLYNFDCDFFPAGNSQWIVKGSFGFVLSSAEEGLITQVFLDNFTGWVESKYLFEIKGQ
jgi:hypothetical protein